jgi:hypothetical protein
MTARSNRPDGVFERLTTRVTRRAIVQSGGLIGAGAVLGRAALLRAAAQESPLLIDAINAAITVEAFAVTFCGAARGRGDDIGFDDAVSRFVRATQCEEEAHFHFFEAAGAVPATTSFTVPSNQLRDQKRFLTALSRLEGVLVGLHMAAGRQFAAAGDLRLVEIGYQIGAVEAQHQALTRLFLSERVPSERAYAKWMFRQPMEAVAALEEFGYIGGDGEEFSYPGPVDRQCRGVSGLVPETTEDQPEREAPPAASPQATPMA